MTPPYAGTHTESRFAREIQQESSNNVALHFRASAPSAPTKSIAYVTRPRTKCRRWVKRSAYPFCHGERNEVGRSQIPIARTRASNAAPKARSLSRTRYFGTQSHGNASVI